MKILRSIYWGEYDGVVSEKRVAVGAFIDADSMRKKVETDISETFPGGLPAGWKFYIHSEEIEQGQPSVP